MSGYRACTEACMQPRGEGVQARLEQETECMLHCIHDVGQAWLIPLPCTHASDNTKRKGTRQTPAGYTLPLPGLTPARLTPLGYRNTGGAWPSSSSLPSSPKSPDASGWKNASAASARRCRPAWQIGKSVCVSFHPAKTASTIAHAQAGARGGHENWLLLCKSFEYIAEPERGMAPVIRATRACTHSLTQLTALSSRATTGAVVSSSVALALSLAQNIHHA